MSVSEPAALTFEPLREAHLDAVLAIEVEAYPEAWSIGMFREEIRSPRSHFWSVFLDGVLMGYGGFWLVLDEAHITSVTVRDTYRRRGFGRELMQHLLREASTLGVRRAMLEVRASNLGAKALYEGMGFTVTGVRKRYYSKSNEDAIVMLKEWSPGSSD